MTNPPDAVSGAATPAQQPTCDPCPFCGEEPEETHGNDLSYYYVGCANENCAVQPETGLEASAEKAIAAWNWKPAATPEAQIPEDLRATLAKAVDRHVMDESLTELVHIAANGIHWRNRRIAELESQLAALRVERDQAWNALREIQGYAIHGCGTRQKDIRGKQFGAIVDITLALGIDPLARPIPAEPGEGKEVPNGLD